MNLDVDLHRNAWLESECVGGLVRSGWSDFVISSLRIRDGEFLFRDLGI